MILADEQNEFGGWLLAENDTQIEGVDASAWIAGMVAELETMPEVTLLPRTTVFGYMDHNYLTLVERVTDHLAERPAHLPRQHYGKCGPARPCWRRARMNGPWCFPAMICLV